MELDNLTKLNLLYDYYGSLLTERQKQLFEWYCQYDLSLGEIAENAGISRQAVHDLLRRTVAQLKGYEANLGLVDREERRQQVLEALERAVREGKRDRALFLVGKLKQI